MGLSPEFRYRQETYTQLEAIAQEILQSKQCFSLSSLALDGRDMIALGLKGKEIGNALNELLNAVVENKAENTRDSLMEYYHTYVKFK